MAATLTRERLIGAAPETTMVEPKLTPADIQGLNSVDMRVVEEIIAAIIEFNGWGAKPEEARVELLKKVADGEVSPEEAARTFPGA